MLMEDLQNMLSYLFAARCTTESKQVHSVVNTCQRQIHEKHNGQNDITASIENDPVKSTKSSGDQVFKFLIKSEDHQPSVRGP